MSQTIEKAAPAGSGPRPLIAGTGLTIDIAGRRILDAVDIAISRGEIVTLVGLNGSGKTTLARALLGLMPLSAGRVDRQPGLTVGYVPQSLALDRTLPLTVKRFLGLAGRAVPAALSAVLDEVGLAALIDSQVTALSGGELRRVMLARALLHEPDLLVLDEPMSGVDVSGQVELYDLIDRIRRRHHCGVLLVSHDLHLVMAATDRVVCLNHHVCCTGQPDAVLENAEFRALFGDRVAQALAVYHHQHDHRHAADGRVVPIGHGAAGHDHAHRDHGGHDHAGDGPAS